MKKFATLAAAAALVAAAAAPVAAQDASADPFVSSQGALGASPALVAGLTVALIMGLAAIDPSDGT